MKVSHDVVREDDVPGIHVAILIPSHDMIHSTFAYDLARLCILTSGSFMAPGSISKLSIHTATDTLIHRARQSLADAALEYGADYALWLDADMRFPKEILIQMLMRAEELHPLEGHVYPLLGVNYSTRGMPPRYVAWKKVPDRERADGERLVTDDTTSGMEDVEAFGFGCVLMHTNVLKALDEKRPRPWFRFAYDDELGKHIGEDVYFCRLVRELGFPAVIDHDVSKGVRHTGTFEYALGHVLDYEEGLRDAREAQENAAADDV